MLSSVVSRLLALNSNSDKYFDEVLLLAQESPTFAVRIIHLSNSASSAPVEQVVSLREAVVRLGVSNISSLIATLAVNQVFMPTTEALRDLRIHSIRVAVMARTIACTTTAFKVSAENAYLCGLLHDVGHFILLQNSDKTLPKAVAPSSAKEYITTEKDSNGFNHTILGALICKTWQMPALVCKVVKYHHRLEFPKEIENDPKIINLIHTNQLADMMCVFLSLNPDALNLDEENLIECLQNEVIDAYPGPPPVSAQDLAALAGVMWQEASDMVQSLTTQESK